MVSSITRVLRYPSLVQTRRIAKALCKCELLSGAASPTHPTGLLRRVAPQWSILSSNLSTTQGFSKRGKFRQRSLVHGTQS